jgi:tripartite-type tricarboxylate transporter receptor subunit TctC
MFRNLAATAAVVLGLLCSALPVAAQNFPTKPVRIVTPFPAGGSTDLFLRILSVKMQESTGQSWLIDYKAGGATMIATVAVKNSAPDGYTVLLATNVAPNNLLMYKKVEYKLEDFAPVSLIATGPLAMSVSKSLPANNIAELIAYVKANPGKVNYATLGAGGTPHLLAKMLEQHSGLQMVEIPYKGAAPALQALIAGDVQIYFDSVPSSLAQLKAGAVKIFGVTSEERMKGAPDLPTLKEQGLPLTAVPWFGFWVPAATPKPLIAAIHREVVKAVASQEYQTRVIGAAQVPVSSASPEEFQTFIARQAEGWAKVIKPLNLQLD